MRKFQIRRLSATAAFMCLGIVAASCSSASVKSSPSVGINGMPIVPTSTMVGPSGGMAASSDGAIEVTIPAGALPANVAITVQPAAVPAAGALGTVFEIGPTGTQFTTPVTMTFHYDSTDLGSHTAAELRAATYANGAWQILPGFQEDTTGMTVSGTTTHLSPYGIVVAATGSVCAPVAAHAGCAADASATASGAPSSGGNSGVVNSGGGGGSGGGGTSGGSPATGTGTTTSNLDAGASSAPVCAPTETCATATNACSQYPGASLSSCTDDSSGYNAQCCFAPSAAICLAVSIFESCEGNASGGSGGTLSAAPADASAGSPPSTSPSPSPAPTCTLPTCATSSPCAQYPGAKVQDCTDGPSGVTASCCFDPGASVCFSEGAGGGCSSSPGGSTCAGAPTCATGNPCSDYAGATVRSCTDSASGYQATCCLPAGVLPSTAATTGNSASHGGSTISSSPGAADASAGSPFTGTNSGGGTSGGQPSGGSGGGSGGFALDASSGPPQGSGTPPQGEADAGGFSGGGNPGQTGAPDASGPGNQPSPADAGTGPSQPCQPKPTLSPMGPGSPCALQESCPDGHLYEIACDGSDASATDPGDGGGVSCTCTTDGVSTGQVFASCNTYSPQMLAACGYPVN